MKRYCTSVVSGASVNTVIYIVSRIQSIWKCWKYITTGTFTAWTGYQFDRLPLAKLYPGRDIVEYFPYHTEFYMEITPGGLVNMNAKQNVSTTGISVQCSKIFMLAN